MFHVLRAVRMYRAFRGVLEERLNFKEEKNRDGTGRTITEKTEKGTDHSRPSLDHHSSYFLINFSFVLFCVCISCICVYA